MQFPHLYGFCKIEIEFLGWFTEVFVTVIIKNVLPFLKNACSLTRCKLQEIH